MATSDVAEEGGEARHEWLPRKPLVQPEGGGAAVHHRCPGDRAVEWEALLDNPLQEGGGGGGVPEIATCVREIPSLPRQRVRLVEFVYKV
jgi:hypothetical protein